MIYLSLWRDGAVGGWGLDRQTTGPPWTGFRKASDELVPASADPQVGQLIDGV